MNSGRQSHELTAQIGSLLCDRQDDEASRGRRVLWWCGSERGMWRTSPDPGRSTAALPSTRPKMPNSPRWPMRSPRWTRTFSPSRRSVTPPPCRTWRTSSPATPMWPPRTRTAAASASDICRSLSSLVCGRSRPSRPRCARSRLTTPPPPRVRWVVPRSSPASPLRRRRRRPGHLPPQVEAALLSRWFVQHPRRGSARPLQRLRPLPPRRRSRHCPRHRHPTAGWAGSAACGRDAMTLP